MRSDDAKIAIDYAEDYMDSLNGQGFCPDELTKRAVLIEALYRIKGEPKVDEADVQFADVSLDASYATAARYFRSYFLRLHVWEDILLRPEEPVTAEEAAALLYGDAALWLSIYDYERRAENTLLHDFEVNTPETWAQSGVQWTIDLGLMPESAVDAPKEALTRGETALLLYGYQDILQWPGMGNAKGSEKNVLTAYGPSGQASYVLSRADAKKLEKLFQDARWSGLDEPGANVAMASVYSIKLGDITYGIFAEDGELILHYNYYSDETGISGGHPTSDPALVEEIFEICRSYAPPVKGERIETAF